MIQRSHHRRIDSVPSCFALSVFRSIGHVDDLIVSAAPPLKHWRCTSYSTSLNIGDHWSNLLCVHDHFQGLRTAGKSYVDPHSPSVIANFPQNKLVHLLLEHGLAKLELQDISDCVNLLLSSKTLTDADEAMLAERLPLRNAMIGSHVRQCLSPHGHLLLGYEWAGGFTGRLEVESFLRPTSGEETTLTCRR